MSESADGVIIIKTKMDSSDLEKELNTSIRRLQRYKDEAEKLAERKLKLKATIEINENEYKQKINALNQRYAAEISANTISGRINEDAERKINTKYDQLRYNLDIAYGKSLDQNNTKLAEIDNKIKSNTRNQGLLNQEIDRTNTKLNQTRVLEGAKESVDKANSSISTGISKVGKWGLSLFRVVSIFALVRKAGSTAMTQNEELGKRMTAIWNYVAELVMPIISTIMNWIMKAISVINYFIQLLTGINFAARANERAIKKQSKATSGAAKATKKHAQAQKELNKELATFDEMNKLTDETNKGDDLDSGRSSVGGGGVSTPQLELPELSEETKKRIEKIAEVLKKVWDKLKPIRDIIKQLINWALDHPDIVLGILGGVKLLTTIGKIIGTGGLGGTGLLGILAVLLSIAAVKGIEKVGEAIKKLKKETSQNAKTSKTNADNWETLTKKIKKNGVTTEQANKIIKINSATIGDNAKAKAKNLSSTSTLGAWVDALTGNYKKNNQILKDNIRGMYENKNAMVEAYNQSDKNNAITQDMITYLSNYRTSLIETNDALESNSVTSADFRKEIQQNKHEINETALQIGYLIYQTEGGTKSFESWRKQVENSDKQMQYLQYRLNGGTKSFGDWQKEVNEASKKVSGLASSVANLNGKKATIKVDANVAEAQKKLKNLINNNVLAALQKSVSAVGLAVKIPRLATGGIINMPGRGVPIGGAIAGESGREGVIPLTDSQQMALLGEAIGKYININATVPVYVGNRQIAKEIKRINAEDDFAYNR